MTRGWLIFVAFWALTSTLAIVGDILLLRRRDVWTVPDRRASIVLSTFAALPSIATLAELIVRSVTNIRADKYWFQIPLLISVLVGPILFIVSAAVYPYARRERALNAVRVGHLVTWGCGVVMAGALVLNV